MLLLLSQGGRSLPSRSLALLFSGHEQRERTSGACSSAMDGRRAEVVDSDDEALQARLEELCVGRQQRLTGAPPAISPSLSEEVDDERPVGTS